MNQQDQEQKLDAYYSLNRLHLQWAFWCSLVALIVGLIVLVAGVTLIFAGTLGLTGSMLTIGGVLTQFIGAGFFVLYSRNLKQLNIFYEKLVRHQDTMYAIGLVMHHLPDPRKAEMLETVISMLLTRNDPKTPMPPESLKIISDAMEQRRQQRT
jgi:membrane-bound ClpP family serine protease